MYPSNELRLQSGPLMVVSTSFQWTSKYGSVTVAGWDITTIDGMNEAGLVVNVLYLAESD